MAFFDKLGDLAKNIGDKTTDAIETGKLNSKIGSETAAAAAQLQKVGEFYYAKVAAGEQVSPEALEFCQAAAAHYAAAEKAQAEIDRIRAENDAARAASSAVAAPPRSAAGPACTSCGAVNAPGTRFCGSCGAKLR